MQYMGGKARLARKFAPILQQRLAAGGRFVEPFVGGFNLVPVIQPAASFCSDIHPGLISLYSALQAGTFSPPEHIGESEYQALRRRGDWDNPLTAFAAFGCSFGGREWEGYARDKRKTESFACTARRGILRKLERMAGVEFKCIDYQSTPIRAGDVLYADPPYLDTKPYHRVGKFDHAAFFGWCEDIASKGVSVFVSEFTAPQRPRWQEVWRHHRRVQFNSASAKRSHRYDLLLEVLPK